jgi:hypothetical protein
VVATSKRIANGPGGVPTHWPDVVHASDVEQVPQSPVHPSGPHVRPAHSGTHAPPPPPPVEVELDVVDVAVVVALVDVAPPLLDVCAAPPLLDVCAAPPLLDVCAAPPAPAVVLAPPAPLACSLPPPVLPVASPRAPPPAVAAPPSVAAPSLLHAPLATRAAAHSAPARAGARELGALMARSSPGQHTPRRGPVAEFDGAAGRQLSACTATRGRSACRCCR